MNTQWKDYECEFRALKLYISVDNGKYDRNKSQTNYDFNDMANVNRI